MRKGRKRLTQTEITNEFMQYYSLYQRGAISMDDLIKLVGKSRQTIWRYSKLISKVKGKEVEL